MSKPMYIVGRDLVYMNWEGGLSVLSVEDGSRSILDNSTFVSIFLATFF